MTARWSEPLGPMNGARISPCGKYRTLLWRTFEDELGNTWSERKPMVFCMLNPSTADGTQDDPTIRRCLGFARREQCGGIIVVNLSPYRATDPDDLFEAYKNNMNVFRYGENREAFQLSLSLGGVMVYAWGAHFKPWMAIAYGNLELEVVSGRCLPVCLGKSKEGQPRHPLMLRADTALILF